MTAFVAWCSSMCFHGFRCLK